MTEYPMTAPQKSYIEVLRTQMKISPDVMEQICERWTGVQLAELTVRQASSLIEGLKNSDELKRELQILAGQQPLFGGAE